MRLLIVEDERITAMAMRRNFERLGFTVDVHYTISSVPAGVDYTLAILDLNLGETDGIETVRLFRKLRPATPVVVFSGNLGTHEIPDVDASVSKPFDDKLQAACLEAIENRRVALEQLGRQIVDLDALREALAQ